MSDAAGTHGFYITTPIYYVNGRPHIGHAYTTIAADVASRWHRMVGIPARLSTGVDEHGQKVLEKANERGMSPQAHCDDMVVHWRKLMDDLDIELDHFVRTTDASHVGSVQAVLQRLFDAGLIYKDTYVGWYSQSAERFWTEKDLVDGKCPETGQPVTRIEEANWFFKMSQFQQPLLDHIEANPDYVRPVSRRNEVLGFLRKELGDLCISRPKARMGWGIEIPFDRDYVTYVWFDALLNYITGLGYRAEGDSDAAFEAWWPASVQLIGKDILTTHAVYWSTMLLAMDVPLPKTIYAHGWWMSADGAKMSKSLGNTIDVDLLVESYGLDAVRFFLMREIGFGADGQFSYDGFLARYNTDLANDMGNLAHRGLTMTTNWLGGEVPAVGERTPLEDDLVALAGKTVTDVAAAMADLQFQDALEAVCALVRAGNKYVDTVAPWALNKAGDTARLGTALRHVLEVSHLAAALLVPVMPTKSAELLTKLGRTPASAAVTVKAGLDGSADLAALAEGAALVVGEPLFPRFRQQPDGIAAMFAKAEAEAAASDAPPAEAPLSKREQKRRAKAAKKARPKPAGVDDIISYEDFCKLALRVGLVTEARPHSNADKLLVLQVDLGEAIGMRQIVAGLAGTFTPESLVGRKVVVVANLAPADLRGEASQGMILAAGDQAVVDLVGVDAPLGEVVR